MYPGSVYEYSTTGECARLSLCAGKLHRRWPALAYFLAAVSGKEQAADEPGQVHDHGGRLCPSQVSQQPLELASRREVGDAEMNHSRTEGGGFHAPAVNGDFSTTPHYAYVRARA